MNLPDSVAIELRSATFDVRAAPRRFVWILFAPVQAAAAFTVVAIAGGGQMLRVWLLGGFLWLMALPLLASLEAGLFAMMLFEPLRGVVRRAQYLFVDYTAQDPIHLLTPIVTLFAFALLLKTRGLAIIRATPLAGSVSLLAALYAVEIFNPLQGGLLIGLAGTLFMLVPICWFYFGQSIKSEYINTVLRIVIVLALITSAYGLYQLIFGYPGFEQYWIDNTDYYDSIAVGHVKRALATFSSAEEWGRYAEIGAIAAFGFAATAERFRHRAGWFVAGAGLSGAVSVTGQRTAMFGLMLGIAVLVLLGARCLRGALVRLALLMLPVIIVTIFVQAPTADEMWSKDNDQAISTLLSHTTRGTLKPAEEESFQARLENWKYLITQVIPYRPLGAGLGAGSLGEARFKREADLPAIDSFILVVAVACGIPGALLFVWIMSRAMWLALGAARSTDADRRVPAKRTVAAIMFALLLNSIFGLTFTLYSVAPLAWLLIGWISAQSIKTDEDREVLTF